MSDTKTYVPTTLVAQYASVRPGAVEDWQGLEFQPSIDNPSVTYVSVESVLDKFLTDMKQPQIKMSGAATNSWNVVAPWKPDPDTIRELMALLPEATAKQYEQAFRSILSPSTSHVLG